MKRAGIILALIAIAGSATAIEIDDTLYALGSVGLSNIYTTYLVVGAVADGFAAGVYPLNTAADILRETASLNESSREALSDMLDSGGFTAEDESVLSDMEEAHRRIGLQISALENYVYGSGGSDIYRRRRDESWSLIRSLIGNPASGGA